MSETPIVRYGWFWPPNARRAHFFFDTPTSICGGYLLFAFAQLDAREFENSDHNSPDNCARCKKLRAESAYYQQPPRATAIT